HSNNNDDDNTMGVQTMSMSYLNSAHVDLEQWVSCTF
nr:hypothetical protein [Tanacetum cinerariifolium]